MKRPTHDESREQDETPSTRREILRGGLLIAGAAAAARVVTGGPRQARADNGAPLILGQQNIASSPTSLQIPPGVSGLFVSSEVRDPNEPIASVLRADGGSSTGVEGNSVGGAGVLGQAGPSLVFDPNDVPHVGVYGASVDAIGVVGRSIHNFGVVGRTGSGVVGDPNVALPVAGLAGLAGLSGTGDPNSVLSLVGVLGFATDPNSPGVFASNAAAGGLALDVQGRASFSSAGQGTIPSGMDRVKVTHSAVSPNSIVLATLSSDPIGGRRLKFVQAADGEFTVVLSGKAKVPVDFNFLVVN